MDNFSNPSMNNMGGNMNGHMNGHMGNMNGNMGNMNGHMNNNFNQPNMNNNFNQPNMNNNFNQLNLPVGEAFSCYWGIFSLFGVLALNKHRSAFLGRHVNSGILLYIVNMILCILAVIAAFLEMPIIMIPIYLCVLILGILCIASSIFGALGKEPIIKNNFIDFVGMRSLNRA